MLAKLDTEPIEDLRIDLEDGYGVRDDETEDRARSRPREPWSSGPRPALLHRSAASGSSRSRQPTRRRGLRTLDLVIGTLVDAGGLPDGWVVTLPKVTSVDQVTRWSRPVARLEAAYGLPGPAALVRDPGRDAAGGPGADGTAPWPG